MKRKVDVLDEKTSSESEEDHPKTEGQTIENKQSSRKRSRPEFLHEKILTSNPTYNESEGSSANRLASGGPGKRKISSKLIIHKESEPIPNRDADGCLRFPDYPEFRPNLTPKEVLQLGSFGGTYFRIISSSITGERYKDVWKEFPSDWFEGLNISRQITSQSYDTSVNRYKVECGGDLKMWEESGWITELDPYGWFQWYCRFYLGRRSTDDERQVGRALGVMGPTGRWRRNLINKCLQKGNPEQVLNDTKISPKIRQLLQHWGYRLTLKDLKKGLGR